MKGWYKAVVDRTPPPTWVTPDWIMVEHVDLYRQVPPPGEKIPVSVKLFQVEDSVPTEDEIERVVRQIRKNRSGGPSGMKSERLPTMTSLIIQERPSLLLIMDGPHRHL